MHRLRTRGKPIERFRYVLDEPRVFTADRRRVARGAFVFALDKHLGYNNTVSVLHFQLPKAPMEEKKHHGI